MTEPLDELYFKWLYGQVGDPEIKDPIHSYWRMLKLLFTKEFVWLVARDDNRIEDGKDLRYEFVDDARLDDVDLDWINMGCSMLELLMGLSRRLAFEAEGEPRSWFWHLIENLGLWSFNDKRKWSDEEVDDILNRVIWRTYDRDGKGGLFPLRRPSRDQREVELWYQLSEYVMERT